MGLKLAVAAKVFLVFPTKAVSQVRGKSALKRFIPVKVNINVNSSNGAISANDTGVYAKHENEGDINIENSSQIAVTGTEVSAEANGIKVKHSGAGNVDIENSAQINTEVTAFTFYTLAQETEILTLL